uniref:Uncharacterized protein n=1 Tax=Cucumis melo TaxID=3656 RepID=A0A9I9ED77_CUCME
MLCSSVNLCASFLVAHPRTSITSLLMPKFIIEISEYVVILKETFVTNNGHVKHCMRTAFSLI